MDSEISFVTFKAFCIGLLIQSFGLYGGAISIAFFASILKLFYHNNDCPEDCFLCCITIQFGKYFGVSLPLTLLMVHISLFYNLETQATIIASAIVAFLGREILDIIIKEVPPMFKMFLLGNYKK